MLCRWLQYCLNTPLPVRLPVLGICKILIMAMSVYLEDCGVKSAKSLAKQNENWPAYAEVGLAPEWIDERSLDS